MAFAAKVMSSRGRGTGKIDAGPMSRHSPKELDGLADMIKLIWQSGQVMRLVSTVGTRDLAGAPGDALHSIAIQLG